MKNERGITLVALIITIIVMLILATISINLALGDNGIFKSTSKAEVMNKVQALDDTIKAYALKNNNPYSSSKKTISDLIDEGILKQITLEGENKESDEDNKTIFYVNFENTEINVAERLGLDPEKYENKTKLGENLTYTKLEDLQNKGIYVIDNDMNAAYLQDNRTYGKLINFGEIDNTQIASEYNSQRLTLIVNPKSEVAQEQEVVMVIDRTVSMALPDSGGDGENMPIDRNGNSIDYTTSYQKTRWYGATTALDNFIDNYFVEDSVKRKLTIITFYGQQGDKKIENLGTFTDKSAKDVYKNIFSEQQFKTVVQNVLKRNRNVSCQYSNGLTGSGRGYYSGITPASLGNYTCTPNALNTAYEYMKKNTIPTDVIVMTDGDSNTYWSPCNNAKSIGTVAKNIMSINIAGHDSGVYAVGFGSDAGNFRSDFGGNYTDFFTSANSDQLNTNFQAILEQINQNIDAITNTENSHSIMISDTEEYSIEKANRIIVELSHVSNDESKTITLTFDKYNGAGSYKLDDIYDESTGHILLENAWQYSKLPPSELNYEYNKTVTIFTD